MEEKDRPTQEGKPELPNFIERFALHIVIALCVVVTIVAYYVAYKPGSLTNL